MWRGVACLSVVLFHSARGPSREIDGFSAAVFAILGKGWIGVPLFFVISGYCVTASADALRSQPYSAKHFFWRRFRRIYPPYWAVIAIILICGYLLQSICSGHFFQILEVPNPRELSAWQWFGNLSLTQTWLWHLTGGAEMKLLPPSWTLCYEEQFYFLVGLVLILTRRLFFPSLALLTLVVAIQYVFPQPGLYPEGLFLDGHWLMFASGVLVYYATNYVPARKQIWFCVPLITGILCAVPELRQFEHPVNQSYFAAFSFALVILALKPWDQKLISMTMLSPLYSCGEMCYSLYLLHWPVVLAVGHIFDLCGADSSRTILMFKIPLCVTTALVAGGIFHRLIERRFWNPRIKGLDSKAKRAVAPYRPEPSPRVEQ